MANNSGPASRKATVISYVLGIENRGNDSNSRSVLEKLLGRRLIADLHGCVGPLTRPKGVLGASDSREGSLGIMPKAHT